MNIEKTIRSLKSRRFDVSCFDSSKSAADYLVNEIKGTTVGIGGSITVDQLNIYDRLSENNDVAWHWKDKSDDVLERAYSAKVYITGANAISEDGDIILIDGNGNRISSVAYGQNKTVYILAGTNKICPDFESALSRARNIAAPKNVRRIKPDTAQNPCLKAGRCYDCRTLDRICNAMLVLWGKMNGSTKYEVVLIEEELGY